MTLNDLKQRLKEVGTALLENESVKKQVELSAALAVEAEHKNRIFVEGKATNGSQIGTYSKSEMYLSKSQLVGLPKAKFEPQGKVNKTGEFKNGKKRKSMYLSDGYSEFRKTVGRQNGKVDLNLTGSTLANIQTGTKNGKPHYGFLTEKSKDLMAAHEVRFKKEIVKVSDSEVNVGIETAQKIVIDIIKSII